MNIICVLYLSADPDDIISPSGDQEHLIKFWNNNIEKKIVYSKLTFEP